MAAQSRKMDSNASQSVNDTTVPANKAAKSTSRAGAREPNPQTTAPKATRPALPTLAPAAWTPAVGECPVRSSIKVRLADRIAGNARKL